MFFTSNQTDASTEPPAAKGIKFTKELVPEVKGETEQAISSMVEKAKFLKRLPPHMDTEPAIQNADLQRDTIPPLKQLVEDNRALKCDILALTTAF